MKPGAHSLHKGEPAAENFPSSQEVQVENPASALENVFGPQISQSNDESCLVASVPSSGISESGRHEVHVTWREAEVPASGL